MSKQPKVAMCAILRDERRYILEWIAYHQLIGIGEFLIFDNESSDGSELLLAALRDRGIVQVVRRGGRGMNVQLGAFLEGARALSLRNDFVAFLDLDEFLVTDDGRDIRTVLSETPSDVGAIAICQMVFGSNNRLKREPDLVISRFTTRAADERPEHKWVKTIARPEFVQGFTSPHSAALWNGRCVMTDFRNFAAAGAFPGESDRIHHGGIHYNHYMLKSWEEFREKQARGTFGDNNDAPRLADAYFTMRDPGSNAVVDLRAAERADRVRAQIRSLVKDFGPDLRAIVYSDLGL